MTEDTKVDFRNLRCRFCVEPSADGVLFIRDLCDEDREPRMTVTNDIEQVVHHLWSIGMLNNVRPRLIYQDTIGSIDEVTMRDKKFQAFRFLSPAEVADLVG